MTAELHLLVGVNGTPKRIVTAHLKANGIIDEEVGPSDFRNIALQVNPAESTRVWDLVHQSVNHLLNYGQHIAVRHFYGPAASRTKIISIAESYGAKVIGHVVELSWLDFEEVMRDRGKSEAFGDLKKFYLRMANEVPDASNLYNEGFSGVFAYKWTDLKNTELAKR